MATSKAVRPTCTVCGASADELNMSVNITELVDSPVGPARGQTDYSPTTVAIGWFCPECGAQQVNPDLVAVAVHKLTALNVDIG